MTGTFKARGVVRRLVPFEADALSEHLLRLDEPARLRRFLNLATDTAVRAHAARAMATGAIVYGYHDEGVLRAAAELHPLAGERRVAEAAFSVEAPYREQGIGTELFRRLMVSARNRGIHRLALHCLPGNLAMRRLAERFGSTVVIEEGEAYAELDAARATPLSYFSEWMADQTALAKTVLDARLLRLKAA